VINFIPVCLYPAAHPVGVVTPRVKFGKIRILGMIADSVYVISAHQFIPTVVTVR